MSVSAVTPWLIRPLRQERALLFGVLASIALHTLVLLGLSTHGAPAPPAPSVRTLPVLTARLAPVVTAPTEQAPQTLAAPNPPASPTPALSKPELAPEPELKLEPRLEPKPEPKPEPKREPKLKPAPAPVPSKRAPKPAPSPRKPVAPPRKAPPVAAAKPAPREPVPEASAAGASGAQTAAPQQARSAPLAPVGAPSEANANFGDEADKGIMERYRMALIAATRRYKRYPAIAMEKGWQGRVEVHMVIGANGMLARASVKTSSGHEILDKQAIDMLRKGKTTVQIPSRLRGREFSIDVPVIFNLDNPNS